MQVSQCGYVCVCRRYSPPGNVEGQFDVNVLPRQGSALVNPPSPPAPQPPVNPPQPSTPPSQTPNKPKEGTIPEGYYMRCVRGLRNAAYTTPGQMWLLPLCANTNDDRPLLAARLECCALRQSHAETLIRHFMIKALCLTATSKLRQCKPIMNEIKKWPIIAAVCLLVGCGPG